MGHWTQLMPLPSMLVRLGRMTEPMSDANRPGPLSKDELQMNGAMSGVSAVM